MPILDAATRRVCAEVAADPGLPRTVGVVAPGGYGKSVVLAEISAAYRRAGQLVITAPEAIEDLAGQEPAALVVDDAHRLPETQLVALRELADAGRLGLVVAYRPWPRPPALAELAEVLGRGGPPLVPMPFDREQVGRFLAARLGRAPSPAAVEFVHAQTGGVPRFVERLAASRAPAGPSVPESAIRAFRHDLEALDDDVQRFLLAVEAGAGLHVELLAGLLNSPSPWAFPWAPPPGRLASVSTFSAAQNVDTDASRRSVAEVMAAARASGLLADDGSLLPISRAALAALIPAERRVAVRQRLAELQLDAGGPVLPLAGGLLGTGVVGARAAAVFHAAAREAAADRPELAARLFHAAAAAGTPVTAVGAGWAHAAALSGDLDTALRLADQVFAAPDSAERATAASAAAAALAHRGQLGRSAELYRWAGTGPSAAFATVGLIGSGRATEADGLTGPADDGPPTILAGAASLLAQGLRESVNGSNAEALATLVRAATLLEPTGSAEPLPDTPAAVAAIVAVHSGELAVAESVLDRAVTCGMGGALMAARHRLLQAWVRMVRGNGAPLPPARLEPRDALFAAALQVGLARRNSDLPALGQAWRYACDAMMRHPVDLFTLLPLGEFVIAAARLGDQARVRAQLGQARSLLAALGNPPLWSMQLHWSELHAAIIAEQPALAEEHAAALATGTGPFGGVLATAARCWLDVVAGRVDVEQVEAAARGLHDTGLCWDGARLAGQAAIRTADRKAMVHLLDCARLLRGRSARAPRTAATDADPGEPAAPATELSARELEVADLVLAGLTYKQIGARLFISAKTVEHHVARMRRRLGCDSRSELLARLRELAAELGTAQDGAAQCGTTATATSSTLASSSNSALTPSSATAG